MSNFIIMDADIVRMNAKMVLEEGLFFTGFVNNNETWCKNYTDAKKHATVEEAIDVARKLEQRPGKPPRIFQVAQNGPAVNITEFKYT
jgi:hypothetical protein